MKKVSLSQCKPYSAPKHFNMAALRLQGKDETGIQKFWVGLSYFLPGGGIEYGGEDASADKVYMILEGEVVVKNKQGEEIVLGPMDTLYIGPNEGRSLINKQNKPAAMLVIANY
jgi:mannose-6-phosphate isomerase-like protein (cupin superfamily)